ncbi:hypothetical protein P4637_10260 [Halalkalibacterium halodurans]|uniref:BH2862 protein n=1 Tax=Halalkalibacterium halodurans (strain ATCC BAA-125 / DSM 18197 / FERM 7344 / JCM 9153 / C-125) TaxID=272558 RepID=Q9K8Z0_HALH5|nr:hypothetical protein [Halalkalibacterium halodurans]MDY7223414.1 hypothetical protein [Halalkalibacterium halodurans]MDY7242635.1 hypothetical protein [Halalkalibacterium halodurans]MED3647326.1 hypothetical protein [Halalkalibacterium halodurans]MED4081658.1 hypothetical protein [Halalkalibacterium halodurans]MED4085211.1 hypothetical protein [Halalkalibacterium halodurans]
MKKRTKAKQRKKRELLKELLKKNLKNLKAPRRGPATQSTKR